MEPITCISRECSFDKRVTDQIHIEK